MFKCSNCGYVSYKWIGKCPECGAWGSLKETSEESLDKTGAYRQSFVKKKTRHSLQPLEILKAKDFSKQTLDLKRYSTGLKEVDRILGGGVLKGAVVLFGGEPGIGKSTLLLQILVNLAKKGAKTLYISSEESASQVLSRVQRLFGDNLPKTFSIASEVDLDKILNSDDLKDFDFVVFDSIQAFVHPGVEGVAGGITQTKATVNLVTNYAKQAGIGVFLIGQVTKTGAVAGPKTVEHVVDAVVYLENLGVANTRIIRAVKNRFGEVGELGFIKMTTKGFVDSPNAESLFVEDSSINLPGASFGVVLHGIRPLVVQVQALLNDTTYSVPRIVVEGLSKNKIEVLSAVINQRMPKVNLSYKDLFVKTLGGLTLKDSGIDLAIVAAIVSAYTGKTFKNIAFIGEVDLLGNIKPALALDSRIKEAKKLGFKRIVSSKNLKHIKELLEL